MSKGKMIVLVGLPGSGKTAYAEELLSGKQPLHGDGAIYRVSWDDLRKELGHTGKFSRQREEEMKKESIKRAECAIRDGDFSNLLIDNTNLSISTRNMWKGLALRLGLDYVEHIMPASIEDCIARDELREGTAQVGRAVIERMALWGGMIGFLGGMWKHPDEKSIVLFDIDGTIADLGHRRLKLFTNDVQSPMWGKKDWYAFYTNVLDDAPIHSIIDLMRLLQSRGFIICIVSGRPIRFKGIEVGKETVAWLKKHDVPYDHIFMRQGDDARSDVIIKQEILDKLPKNRIQYVFDDRASVVSMWRSNGLTCLQVAEGNF